tara:strand:- start:3786 stop:3977 length:192 start_codon:yes stop_codon:yes gene_type:complete
MSKKQAINESPLDALTSESARQRWELFHRAIAHAKESNTASMDEADTHGADPEPVGPMLTIVR